MCEISPWKWLFHPFCRDRFWDKKMSLFEGLALMNFRCIIFEISSWKWLSLEWKSCEYASKYGHLECLKYLHENGCRWSESASRFRMCEISPWNWMSFEWRLLWICIKVWRFRMWKIPMKMDVLGMKNLVNMRLRMGWKILWLIVNNS